ncbi:MAG: nickel-responsive transcriptional regulator NikR [Akkermansiaceae bacterium]
MPQKKIKDGIQRISISVRQSLYLALDKLVSERGFENRSQAISEMIHQSLIDHNEECGEQIMAGTITLFYDETKPGLNQEISAIQRENIAEVISSQHILLENNHTMEVMIVQGPANTLKMISDQLITCKGVKSGRLVLTSTIIPPIHEHQK